MSKIMKSTLLVVVILLLLAALSYLILPYGLFPKIAMPNCGPERWRWLGGRFESKEDVLRYVQEHELELMSGSHTPYLGEFPSDWVVSRMQVDIDWNLIRQDIQVEYRPGYTIYTLVFHHPACSPHQSHTFKVTSFSFASLYGCCGI